MIQLILFFIWLKSLYESYLTLSTIFHNLFFNNKIQNQLSSDTTTAVTRVVSAKGWSLFVLLVTSWHAYDHVVTWLLLTSHILSIILSKIISTGLLLLYQTRWVYILFWSESCVCDWTVLIFLINIKSLYESYLPLSTLFIIFYFKHLIQNRLSADTATVQDIGIYGEFILYKCER